MKEKNKKVYKSYHERFQEIVVENEDDIRNISNIAMDLLRKQFSISFGSKKDGHDESTTYEMPIITFAETYDAIIDHLVKRKTGRIDLTNHRTKDGDEIICVNFANRFIVGVDNEVNEDDEKSGNYMIYINDIRESKMDNDPLEGDSASEKAEVWYHQNVEHDSQAVNMIIMDAIDRLQGYGLAFVEKTVLTAIVCKIYDALVEYIDLRRRELNEPDYEINFAGCFFITAYENAEGSSDIVFRPSIDSKTALKDDATSGFDE